jgi:hypothetical protein
MKSLKWLCVALPVFVGAGLLVASQPSSGQPPPRGVTVVGDVLTVGEKRAVSQAIENIKTGPPTTLTWQDSSGAIHTEASSTIAQQLQHQLEDGQITKVEWVKKTHFGCCFRDCKSTTEGDQVIIHELVIDGAISDPESLKYLQATLIHEWVHKTQCSGQTRAAREMEAYSMKWIYMDRIGVSLFDPVFIGAQDQWYKFRDDWQHQTNTRKRKCLFVDDGLGFLEPGEPPAADTLESFHLGDTTSYKFPLDSFRASDIMPFGDYFPSGNDLLFFCGVVPGQGGRLLALELQDLQVVDTFLIRDYPYYFYSMEGLGTDRYYLVDTLCSCIRVMRDSDGDQLPDADWGVYASAAAFPQLSGLRSVVAATHPTIGCGLLVNFEDADYANTVDPYEQKLFLPDADGNDSADTCLSVRLWEFLSFKPVIQTPLPWAGDSSVALFASWNHIIQVWATDSLGQARNSLLGSAFMSSGVDATCMLNRGLVEGEYIIAVDTTSGEHLDRPHRVTTPTPQGLTIRFIPADSTLELHWEEVPGATSYEICGSADGHVFATQYISYTNSITIDLPSADKYFYCVKAVK